MKKFLQTLVSPFVSNKYSQKFFDFLHRFALLGMNYGRGADPKISGEIGVMDYVAKKIAGRAAPVVFDVGGNIGDYALLAETHLPTAKIYSFEPSKQTFEKLRANTAGKTRITPFNFGLGDENKAMTLYSDAQGSGLASVYKRRLEHFRVNMDISEEIQIKTIDSFCAENNIGHVDFLKLDIEGFELSALSGAKKMLDAGAVDFIQFEFGGCNIDSKTYLQDFFYLLNERYVIYRVLRNGLRPLEKYDEKMEIFITTNYLAEKRNLTAR